MTEDSCPKPSEEPAAAARQRKKRKWDQPAESLFSVGLTVPGALPLGFGSPTGVGVPGIVPLSSSVLMNPVAAACTTASQLYQAPALQQNAAAIIQKLGQPKIQDELIAREIVINDADAAIRCKLTKRQTQEEIQKCTGAVVITRGKYRPSNALPDNDKPLYLHISAGAHDAHSSHNHLKSVKYLGGGVLSTELKDTAERVKAVDRAASMVEEILKQGQSSQLLSSLSVCNSGGQVVQPLSKCLYLGFDPDPTLNIVARIRGPNDQYINHIMNETGVTVMLRGRGSGNAELPHAGDVQEPLHLYLSGNNPKSLEDARILAENLLDTICLECGVSRVSACKGYKAVPPPQKLLDGVESSRNVSGSSVSVSVCSTIDSATAKPSLANVAPVLSGSNIRALSSSLQPNSLANYGHPQASVVPYSQTSISGGTSYSGYGGIYPQATPLQQVALALRQAPVSAASTPATSIFPATASTAMVAKLTSNSGAEKDKRPQRRKFQELPVASNNPPVFHQGFQVWSLDKIGVLAFGAVLRSQDYSHLHFFSIDAMLQDPESLKAGVPSDDLPVKNASSMLPPKLVELQTTGMPPPCPRGTTPPPPQKIMSLPPPSPKFTSSKLPPKAEHENGVPKVPSTEPVPDTLMKLMEYGEEDEDADVNSEEYSKHNSTLKGTAKPFWAV